MDGVDKLALEQAAGEVLRSREDFFSLSDAELNEPGNERAASILDLEEKNQTRLLSLLREYGLNGTVHQGIALMSRGGRLDIVDKVLSTNE